MVKDMTKGRPTKLILAFCIPMLFGNVFQQLYNMCDSIIVGKYVGKEALAGVGSTGAINFLVIGFVMGITNGFCICISQAFGAKDFKKMRKYYINAIYLCLFFTLLLTTLTMIFTRDILIFTQTPKEILSYAYSYIIVIFAGIIFIMMYNFFSCVLRALGDSKTPLYFLIFASVINIALDFLFVLGLSLGAKGAGYATVIAQSISCISCFFYIRKKYPLLALEKDEFTFSPVLCKELLHIGVPMALQFSITAIGSITIQMAVNTLGTNTVAAVTAANKVSMMITQPMETLGITMATFCGQNLGAGRDDRISFGIKRAVIISMLFCAIEIPIVCFGGGIISLLFIDASEVAVIAQIKEFLIINGLCYPFLGLLFVLRNGLQGLGYSILPMMAGVTELFARTFVAFLLVGTLGFQAICIASPIAWFAADILLLFTYLIKIKQLHHRYHYASLRIHTCKGE